MLPLPVTGALQTSPGRRELPVVNPDARVPLCAWTTRLRSLHVPELGARSLS